MWVRVKCNYSNRGVHIDTTRCKVGIFFWLGFGDLGFWIFGFLDFWIFGLGYQNTYLLPLNVCGDNLLYLPHHTRQRILMVLLTRPKPLH